MENNTTNAPELAATGAKSLPAKKELPRINMRPFLYTALGIVFGIFLYCRIRFGGLKATDFVFFILLFTLSFTPFSLRRTAAIFLCFALFAGAGAGLMHAYTQRFLSGMGEGEYEITGTVSAFCPENGHTEATMTALTFNGKKAAGKMSVTVSDESLRAGDVICFTATVMRSSLPENSYTTGAFVKNIRYVARPEGYTVTGRGNALYRLNSAVYDVLHTHMQKTQADTAYALLTGNSGSLDDSFSSLIRQGGIAHIFAVSGLHIGILFSAVVVALKKLKLFRVLPALALALTYSAFCGFTASSLRAVIMCSVLGLYNAIERKYDFLSSIAFAATLLLLIRPAEWLSAGFRLSFAACVGLALFTGSLSRLFKKLPAFLASYLSASLAVQIFTFPILLELFGYFSVWGMVLNFFVIPVLPVLFLGLILCTLFALIIPPAAGVFLAVPNGMLSVLLWLFAIADFSMVMKGFSLGAGATVWIVGVCFLSERVRCSPLARGLFAASFCALFVVCILARNVVFSGCKIITDGNLALIQTPKQHVLVVGESKPALVNDFLTRNYAGKLDAVIILSQNEAAGINSVLSQRFTAIYVRTEVATGLWESEIIAGESICLDDLTFRYEGTQKLTLVAQGRVAEFDFAGEEALGADLFVSSGRATYLLKNRAVYTFS